MDIEELFHEEMINETVKVHPRYLGSNLREYLTDLVRSKFEDKCTVHGYIKRASVELVALGVVQSEMHTLKGYCNCDVAFSALVCNPPQKSTVRATVKNVNKFGVLATCDVAGKEVMQLIVPRNSAKIRSVGDIESIETGDVVSIEILRRKIEVGDTIMYGMGRIVGEHPRAAAAAAVEISTDSDDDVTEDNDEDAVSIILGDGDDAVVVEIEEEDEEEDVKEKDDEEDEDDDDDNEDEDVEDDANDVEDLGDEEFEVEDDVDRS
jgi:DNA-directed RNA polymerase subunit E'/Rpb7